ncbi:hypothetical protein AURDEDRAFT_176611 [Auricularia subglabra TFB-10046 SS5]|uniref:MYND-type domain-containing protein n=1 Tax=Auricularia subglabra (strain TFB-10046 / SS5) TaxID=717982 RepID=J0WR03_AURST|nr:hypothetical protein AURDEDRAFT_176611 [Auricularia subglabra TFB-10046 SS5]
MASAGALMLVARDSQCCRHTSRTLSNALKALNDEVGLPNLKKKSGFKIMHENFDELESRLWNYLLAHSHDEHAVAAVCIIWSRMFLDDVLWSRLGRDPIFQQCVLDLARPGPCDLRLLCYAQMVSMYANARANEPQNLAHVDLLCALLDLLASLPGPESLISDILATAVCSLLNNLVQPRRGVSHFSTQLQAQVLDRFVALPGRVSLCAFEKIFSTIGAAIEMGAIKCPPMISEWYSYLLVGLLRCGGARTRRLAFVQLNTAHDPLRTATPFVFLMNPSSALPASLLGVMQSWGLERCESVRIERTSSACQDILRTLIATRNMTAAALRLFLLVLEDPAGVKFERDCAKRLELGDSQPRPCGFRSWSDILMVASSHARRLQQQTVDAYFVKNNLGRPFPVGYIALVLQIQHVFNLQALASAQDRTYQHAVPLISGGLALYPGDLWLTFADFWTYRHLEDVKSAERGQADYVEAFEQMRKGVSLALGAGTPVALLLLAAIARCAFQITTTFYGSLPSVQCAPMLSFSDDVAARYLARCPPDGLDRLGMVQVRIICRLIIDGPEVGEDLSSALTLVRDLKEAQQFHEALYSTRRITGPHLPGVCLELDLIMARYRDGAQWQPFLQHYWPGAGRKEFHDPNSYARRMDPFCCPSNEDVLRWQVALSHGEVDVEWGQMPHKVFLRVAASPAMLADLPECTHCWKRNPVLRKCAGCLEAAYCDVSW